VPKKQSFLDRLSGAINTEDEPVVDESPTPVSVPVAEQKPALEPEPAEEEEEEAQLSVDVYQTADEIVIRTMVAGVSPHDLDVSITREMVTIRGKRKEAHEKKSDEYFTQELYWGAFSRSILLPEEVDVEDAVAEENHGLLTIRLPMIDKDRKTKLKIKST